MKRLLSIIFILSIQISTFAQQHDSLVIRSIYENAITSMDAYTLLGKLCNDAPGRLIGSDASFDALNIMEEYFKETGADTIIHQKFIARSWQCDSVSLSYMNNGENIFLNSDAIGPSPATAKNGITGEVIELQSLDEMRKLGAEGIKGKIVFLNRPMKKTYLNPFRGYGDAVDQRYWGPKEAARFEAAGLIIRSVNPNIDDFPHTGSCYADTVLVPAVAVSTKGADQLSEALKKNNKLKVTLFVDSKPLKEFETWNLIADIKGKTHPEKIILVGGHLDTWHNTQGAHDDGAGCVHAADVLRIFKELGIENNYTIRAVMFMDEELYQQGGAAYAAYTGENMLEHIIAIESDAGGTTPTGFTLVAPAEFINKVAMFQPLLAPYGINYIQAGYGGVDINPLRVYNVPLSGLNVDPHRYFDYHHCKNDTFDKVSQRELQLGTACLAGYVYLTDRLISF